MLFSNLLLTVETISKLEIVDSNNERFLLLEFTGEKQIATKNGHQLVGIYPLSGDWDNTSATHVVTIKNEDETRSEIHKVLTIHDIKIIVCENMGLTLLYESNVI